jgi:NarL family two-component system response regulator LiaR
VLRGPVRPHFSPGAQPLTAPRVLIVDDEVDGCWLAAFVLRRDPNLALVGEATNGEMALSVVRQERPDVVVMDIMMRHLDGLEATHQIKREWPGTKVLVLTHLTDEDTRRAAFEMGADAFVDKRDMASALVPAIWDACEPGRPRPGSARRR